MKLIGKETVSLKTKLTINFMRKKMKEYDDLRNELDKENFD